MFNNFRVNFQKLTKQLNFQEITIVKLIYFANWLNFDSYLRVSNNLIKSK